MKKAGRYPLAKMYGRMSGWEADKLTEEQLKRKQQLCEEVTFTYNVCSSRLEGGDFCDFTHV